MDIKIVNSIEEQIVSSFTGKINIVAQDSSQILGCAYIIKGSLVNVKYKGVQGVKAFYNACIDSQDTEVSIVVEPEFIDEREKKITTPFSVLKRKVTEISDKYNDSKDKRPPDHLKLLIIPSFLNGELLVDSAEFNLLCTLSDYNKVSDVYKNNLLLDYEITNALVGLRQKGAIKVLSGK